MQNEKNTILDDSQIDPEIIKSTMRLLDRGSQLKSYNNYLYELNKQLKMEEEKSAKCAICGKHSDKMFYAFHKTGEHTERIAGTYKQRRLITEGKNVRLCSNCASEVKSKKKFERYFLWIIIQLIGMIAGLGININNSIFLGAMFGGTIAFTISMFIKLFIDKFGNEYRVLD